MSRSVTIFLLVLLVSATACSKNPTTNQNAAPPPVTNPDVKDTEGFTPLMNAAKNSDMDGAQRAIANGANLNAGNNDGITALFVAAGLGNQELTQILIEKGANVNAKTTSGFTPLMQAALTGQIEIIKVLLAAGADPTAIDRVSKKNATDFAQQSQSLDSSKKKEIAELLKISPSQSLMDKGEKGTKPKK